MRQNNRAITPIISVVLLLMMTVGISGFAWVWLQSVTGGIMDTTKNMTDKQIEQMLTSMEIADYGVTCNATHVQNVTFLIYNRGSTKIDLRTVLVGGAKVPSGDLALTPALQPGELGEVTIASAQKYFKGLNRTSTAGGAVVISSSQGYITKTVSVSGSRCPQP